MILTHAISGIARSGATRSGYPVLLGHKVPLYALSNIARSGATRSNYVGTKAFINIGGIDYGWGAVGYPGVLAELLTKSDAINNTPVTVAFTARGWVPVEGTDVVITLGSKNNGRREFGGTILSTRHRYVGDKPVAANMLYDASCIDYTWGLDRRKASGSYVNASVAAIAASLLTFAPAGYTLQVDADIGAEILDAMTVTEQTLSSAFTQLAQRVGGSFLCDYSKVVHLCYDTASIAPPPAIVNAVHASMAGITFTRDLSQVITRCLGSFGGSNALEQIAPGATLLPVETAAWYLAQGGTVLVAQQRVNYSGLVVGGGGSLVGPGAAPTGAPNAVINPGAGVDVGSHDYAVTFKTTSGESIPGPRLTVPVGLFLAPTTAPTPGTPGPGATGPDPGVHDYAVSYVISGGETVPGPRVSVSTTLTPPPDTGPTPDRVDVGPGPDPGTHDYAVTFVTATGETTPGPIGGQITTGPLPAPTNAPSATLQDGPGPNPGDHYYVYTFVRPEGETITSPNVGPITTGIVAPPPTAPAIALVAGAGLDAGTHAYAVTFVTSAGETTPGPSAGATAGGFGPPHSTPPAPSVSQDSQSGNYTYPGSGGQPGDFVSYAYTLTTTGQSDESAMGPASAQVQIIKSLQAGITQPATNMCSRQVYVDPQGALARLYVSVNGGSWQTVGTTSGAAGWMQVAGTPTSGTYAGPGHGPIASIISLSNIPTASGGVTARRIYRNSSGAGFKLLTTFNNNTTTTYTDTTPNAALGAAPPSVNTARSQTIRVSGIQTAAAGAGVIARKLYRWDAGVWGLAATINDNTTTSVTDTTTTIGAAPPVVNGTTGGAQTVYVSAIPRGSTAGGATARNLYRRSAGAGLRLVATIADNSSSTYTDTTPNASLGAAPPAANAATLRVIPLTAIPLGNSLVLSRKVYRTPANTGGGTLKLVATIADNVTTTLTDTVTDAALGAAALTVGTAQAAQVQLTAIPLGAPAVTARVIYRTKAGLSQLQLLTTIADNTTATWLDVAVDTTLGANAPTSDTSLLTQPAGNVFAGSPSLPCASVAGFLTSGGWAIAGSMNVRYTGISGTNLVGIPASGPGAISATLSYNTTIVAAAMLTGVPATGLGVIKYTILKGDPVNLFVQVDDLDAQAAVRAQLPGSDGIIEDEIQDGRLGYAEGVSRCQARLDLLGARDSEGKVGIVTVSYVCRDLNTHAGATATINLGPPINLRGDYLIQRVSVAQFNVPNLNPTYTVEASSLRFSAEEMLRLLRQGAF